MDRLATGTDAEGTKLALRFQAGEADAFNEIYRLYARPVRTYVARMVVDVVEAEDIAHQALMKVLIALPRFEVRGSSFDAWIFAIARNCALDALRRGQRIVAADPDTVVSLQHDRQRSQLHDSDGGDFELSALVDALPRDQRQILLLRYRHGFSVAEIAELMGRSPARVSGARHRALVALEDALAHASHPAARGPRVRTRRRVHALPAVA